MNDAVLIQLADRSPYDAMLALTGERHAAYCAAHDFDYWCEPASDNPVVGWRRIEWLLRAGKAGYAYAVYLDTDCLIVDLSADLRAALAPTGGEPPHYNNGAMYARLTPALLTFLRAVQKQRTVSQTDGVWWERPAGMQRVLNAMLSLPIYAKLVQPIARRWNSLAHWEPEAQPTVLAWHGLPDAAAKLAAMTAKLQEIA